MKLEGNEAGMSSGSGRHRRRMRLHESWLAFRSPAGRLNWVLGRAPVLLPLAAFFAGLAMVAGGLALAREAAGAVGLSVGLLLLSLGGVALLFGVAGLISAGLVWLWVRRRV